MASSSNVNSIGEEDLMEDELERFDDFTLASSWERFISDIEAVCRQWMSDGPKTLLEKGAVLLSFSKTLYKVKLDVKYSSKIYCMEYYFETSKNDKDSDWNCALHDLQLCFGVKDFMVIAPQSASGVVLDAPEASKLLSAMAIAMSNCSSLWPAFVPVHDPSREAFIGIQDMGTVFTRRFEADRMGSQVPVKLMHLEGLYELFVSKFACSTLDFALHLFKVHFKMKATYITLSYDDDNIQGSDANNKDPEENRVEDNHIIPQWDADCPWSEWYSAEDPIKGLELHATWSERVIESSLEMAEMENASPHEAEKWMILPKLSPNLDNSDGNRVGFASQLRLLANALRLSSDAQFMEDFVLVENPASDNMKSSMVVPSPSVLDRVLKDLFHEGTLPDSTKSEHKNSRSIKGAPLESLFAQFCLHSLWIGNCNIRAISVLWLEFVREVRWCWEEGQQLPKMPTNGAIDLSSCLISQKLHLLAICIEKKHGLNEDFHDCIGNDDDTFTPMQQDDQLGDDSIETLVAEKETSNKRDRIGSAGPVGSMMLLLSYQSLHAPFTQAAPIMTEDMHEERLKAVEALGDSFDFSAQLERDILSSDVEIDMSAFKAANPDAMFEDFIRWHSPGDWENEENGKKSPKSCEKKGLMDDWPPPGRLSRRMSKHDNAWRKLWNSAPPLPACEQKSLLDPNREGEKILHYLETLRPHQLLEQMVCTAFRAAADALILTNFGGLKEMTTKLEQLYLTMASVLRPLQGNQMLVDGEITEDLKRLCSVFEHVEELLALAASLHRKFLLAPRLSEAIFSDYNNFYLRRTGTGLIEHDAPKEFDMKQQVRYDERHVVSSMFNPPTARQSWRKVLSMGNLLNAHEPIVREIIFAVRDDAKSNNHYASRNPGGFQQEVETYRMYISGTSNNLRVALSVTSCD